MTPLFDEWIATLGDAFAASSSKGSEGDSSRHTLGSSPSVGRLELVEMVVPNIATSGTPGFEA